MGHFFSAAYVLGKVLALLCRGAVEGILAAHRALPALLLTTQTRSAPQEMLSE